MDRFMNLTMVFFRLAAVLVFAAMLQNPTRLSAAEQPLGGSAPSPRALEASAYDSNRSRMIMIGGASSERIENDVWALDLSSGSARWQKLEPAGSLPRPRIWSHAIYDSANNRVISYGGAIASNFAVNDTWSLDLTTEDGEWTQIRPPTAGPARYGATVVYDSANQRMIVFGGGQGGALYGDVWSFGLVPGSEDWTRMRPSGSPTPGQRQVTAAYDPENNRMVFYSGFGGERGFFNIDTWSLDLSTDDGAWIRIQPSGLSPIWRVWHSTTYDTVNKRMIIYGGIAFISLPEKPDAFNLSVEQPAWVQLAPTGDTQPGPRVLFTLVFDSAGQRMIMYGGGQDGQGPTGDIWAMEGPPRSETWRQLVPGASAIVGNYGPMAYSLSEDALWVSAGGISLEMSLDNPNAK
ncbi:MAG: hypothetical protein HYR55_00230 [Acidobacteria bacterium]|nr:hypothetical protein [Acidobacteriota bacterium]MBI3658163.1 hypothetical protein [Acidobacteriota bacterium]